MGYSSGLLLLRGCVIPDSYNAEDTRGPRKREFQTRANLMNGIDFGLPLASAKGPRCRS